MGSPTCRGLDALSDFVKWDVMAAASIAVPAPSGQMPKSTGTSLPDQNPQLPRINIRQFSGVAAA